MLELGIYISHIVWRIRYRKLRKEAKATGKSIDELLDLQRNGSEGTPDLEAGVLENQESAGRRSASTSEVEPPDISEKC